MAVGWREGCSSNTCSLPHPHLLLPPCKETQLDILPTLLLWLAECSHLIAGETEKHKLCQAKNQDLFTNTEEWILP